MKSRIYADHAATTPLCDTVWNAMVPFLREEYGKMFGGMRLTICLRIG